MHEVAGLAADMFVLGSDVWIRAEICNVVHQQNLHLTHRRPFCHQAHAAANRRRQSIQEKTPSAEACRWPLTCFCCAVSDRLGCNISFSGHLFFCFPPIPCAGAFWVPCVMRLSPANFLHHVNLNSQESTFLKAVLTLCCAVAVVVHGATLAELPLSCRAGALSRTFF